MSDNLQYERSPELSSPCSCHEQELPTHKSSSKCGCQQKSRPEAYEGNLLRRLISRRGMFASLLRTSGAIGAWQILGAKQASAQTLPLDPDWMNMLQIAQANSKNQAALFKKGKGLIASFGDNLYNLDFQTNSFKLFTGSSLIFNGTYGIEVAGDLNRIVTGNTLTYFQTIVRAGDNSGLFLKSKIEVIDPCSFRIQGDMEAGLLNQNPTLHLSTIDDGREGLFPQGVTKSGVAPAFDITPLDFAAHLIASTFNVRMPPNPTNSSIVPPPPPGTTVSSPPRGVASFWRDAAACFLCGLSVGCCLTNPLCCPAVGVCAEWLDAL